MIHDDPYDDSESQDDTNEPDCGGETVVGSLCLSPVSPSDDSEWADCWKRQAQMLDSAMGMLEECPQMKKLAAKTIKQIKPPFSVDDDDATPMMTRSAGRS